MSKSEMEKAKADVDKKTDAVFRIGTKIGNIRKKMTKLGNEIDEAQAALDAACLALSNAWQKLHAPIEPVSQPGNDAP